MFSPNNRATANMMTQRNGHKRSGAKQKNSKIESVSRGGHSVCGFAQKMATKDFIKLMPVKYQKNGLFEKHSRD